MADGSTGEYASEESFPSTWERPTVFYNDAVKWLVYGLLVAFVLWSAWEMRVSTDRILAGAEGAFGLVTAMVPPDFTPDARMRIWNGMVESVAMAIVATIIGVILSTPIAVIAAENLVPRPVYVVGRAIVSVSRALHELVLGIIAVIAVGFGPLAGVIALVFATPGFFSKLLAEDLEDIDAGQVDAIRATGANQLQVLLYGVAPQVLPRFIGLAIYRWDINIRASAIIGIVGAGGIGQTLLNSFDQYDYAFSSAIILSIVAVVLLGEIASAWWRRRVQ
jgi:phosphonate transport system permease protein